MRRLLGRARTQAEAGVGADSYVGLFRGVIETDAPAASGFVRLEVNHRKKATGCFLFFVDGEVLSGAIEGASSGTGFVDASFRLGSGHARGGSAPGEDLTIRFV